LTVENGWISIDLLEVFFDFNIGRLPFGIFINRMTYFAAEDKFDKMT